MDAKSFDISEAKETVRRCDLRVANDHGQLDMLGAYSELSALAQTLIAHIESIGGTTNAR